MEAADGSDGSRGDDCAAAATNRESEESEEARRVRALEVEVKNLCAQVDRRGWDSIGGHPLGPRCRFWVAALLPWTRTGGRILYHLQPTHALDASHNYDGILSFFSLYYVFFGIFAMEQVGRRVPSLSSQACLQRIFAPCVEEWPNTPQKLAGTLQKSPCPQRFLTINLSLSWQITSFLNERNSRQKRQFRTGSIRLRLRRPREASARAPGRWPSRQRSRLQSAADRKGYGRSHARGCRSANLSTRQGR